MTISLHGNKNNDMLSVMSLFVSLSLSLLSSNYLEVYNSVLYIFIYGYVYIFKYVDTCPIVDPFACKSWSKYDKRRWHSQGIDLALLGIRTESMYDIYVPGSGSPPHPPCHGHGHNPSSPIPPVEWVGPGKGWASSNQAAAM